MLNGCKVTVINPRLEFYHKHHYLKNFTQTTNIDLKAEDKFHRNDLIYLMKKSPETQYFLTINAESRHDIESELTHLVESWPVKKHPSLGLTKFDNVTLWIYDAIGKQPHNVQDDHRLYSCMRYFLDFVQDEDFEKKHQAEAMYINDWWKYRSQAEYDLKTLKYENQLLKKQMNSLYNERLKHISNYETIFSEQKTARIDIINISYSKEELCDLEWMSTSDTSARVQAPLWYTNNGQGYVLQSDKGEITFEVKCIGDGELNIALRGICKRDANGKDIPVWINYIEMNINNNKIFNEKISVWHNRPYKYSCKVKDGEKITCTVAWETCIQEAAE